MGAVDASSLREVFVSNDELLNKQVGDIRKDVNNYKKKHLENADDEKFVLDYTILLKRKIHTILTLINF